MRRSSIPPVWVLNLPRSPERRARISGHLEELGLEYEIIEAVDGRAMSAEETARAVDSKKVQRVLGRQLLPVEVGASLSHRKVYEKQVAEGRESVVILEDDAVLEPGFFEVMERRDELPAGWELVYFYLGDTRTSFWGRRRVGSRTCVRFASLGFGAVAYMLRLSGAQKLLEHSSPVIAPADYLTGGGVRTGVRIYGLVPPCAHEFSPGAATSTMPEAHAVHPRWPSRSEYHPALWMLHRLKWGLVHFNERYNPFCMI